MDKGNLVSIFTLVFACDTGVILPFTFFHPPYVSCSTLCFLQLLIDDLKCQHYHWRTVFESPSLKASPSCCIPLVLNRLFRSFSIIHTLCILCFCLKQADCVMFSAFISVTPVFILIALSLWFATGWSNLLMLWLARGCMICLIFGCSCAWPCQLNIRHIPTESGIDFWAFCCVTEKKTHGVRSSGKMVLDCKLWSQPLIIYH